jgi:hypothetical protein
VGNDDIDNWIGWISGILTFLAIWIGCTLAYGFLAFALAWIPAAIIGVIVGFIMLLFGRFILSVAVILIVVVAFFLWPR